MKLKRQRGMMLIEALVAVFVLALGLLGLGALQAQSVVMNQGAYYRSVATDLAADLADRIRANRTPYFAVDGASTHPDLPLPPDFSKCPQNASDRDAAPTCAATSGHATYLVSDEMDKWNQSLRAALPDGRYSIVKESAVSSAFYRYNVTITWASDRDKNATDSFSSYSTVIE